MQRKTFRQWTATSTKKRYLKQRHRQTVVAINAMALRCAYRTWMQRYRWRIGLYKLRILLRQARLRHVFDCWIKIATLQRQMCLWQRQRERQLCHSVLLGWRAVTADRREVGKMNTYAASMYTQKLLRKATARLKRVVRNRMVVTDMRRRHTHHLLRRLVERWCVFVEARKRDKFAIAWSRQKLCSHAFDQWCALRYREKQRSRALQRFSRRRARKLSAFGNVFTHIAVFNQVADSINFLHKKARRAVWKWYKGTRDAMKVKSIVSVVANREATRVLRDVGWAPWRAMYVWTVKKHEYEATWRYCYLQRIWVKLVDAVQRQRGSRLVHAKAMAYFSKTRMRRGFQSWLQSCAAMREKKARKDRADGLHRAHTMTRVFLMLRQNQSSAASTKVGDMHFIRRILKRWAQVVVSNKQHRRERLAKFVVRMTRLSMQLCFDQWIQVENNPENEQTVCAAPVFVLQDTQAYALEKMGAQVSVLFAITSNSTAGGKAPRDIDNEVCFRGSLARQSCQLRFGVQETTSSRGEHRQSIILKRWLLLRRDGVARKQAVKLYERSLKRASFHRLQRLVVDVKRRVRAWKIRCLRVHWQRWVQLLERKEVLRNANFYWRQFRLRRAVSTWQTRVDQAARLHYQLEVTISWRIAIARQTMFSKWQSYVEQSERYRQCARAVQWRIVGRSVWSRWRRALLQHSMNRVILRRYWDALLQVVKRRQVAKSMWRYAMIRVRLSKWLHFWHQCMEQLRERQNCMMAMVKKQQKRTMRAFFAAWSQFLLVHAFRLVRETRENRRWTRKVWDTWTLRCRVQKWIRTSQRKLLWKVFIFGLKRHAFDCQAYCEQKQWMMKKWIEFATKRRQKRKLSAYVKQLHRFHQASERVKTTRRARVFQEAWILQKQADACRQIKRDAFEAWELVARCNAHGRKKRMEKQQTLAAGPAASDHEYLLGYQDTLEC
ncbi:hypothetical protein FI667_g9268, partial [Globisporangium splendens]